MSVPVLKIVVTVILVAGLSPFLEGFMRKLKAVVHSRMGPPIYQPYLDLLKLLGKEDLRSTDNALFRAAPSVCFGAVLSAALFVPLGYAPALSTSGDMIVLIYLITFSSVAVFMGGLASANPYGSVGASRELMMLFTAEPVLAVTLVVASVKAQSTVMTRLPSESFSLSVAIAAVGFLLALQAQLGKLPFDIVEADQEIMEGPLIEYSGPALALFKWSSYMRQFLFASLFWRIFINWPHFQGHDMPGVLATALNVTANFVEVLILLAVVALVDATNPRLRIDQSVRYFGAVVFLVLCGLAFAFIGS